jgi:hypothetical protein
MSIASVIIIGVLVSTLIVTLEYTLRRVFMKNTEEKSKWKWDKYDTLTLAGVVIIALVVLPIVIHQTTKNNTEIKLFTEQIWPSRTPVTYSQTSLLSPSPMLGSSRTNNSSLKSEGYVNNQQYNVSSPVGFSTVATPIFPSTPQTFESISTQTPYTSTRPMVITPQSSSTLSSKTPYSVTPSSYVSSIAQTPVSSRTPLTSLISQSPAAVRPVVITPSPVVSSVLSPTTSSIPSEIGSAQVPVFDFL